MSEAQKFDLASPLVQQARERISTWTTPPLSVEDMGRLITTWTNLYRASARETLSRKEIEHRVALAFLRASTNSVASWKSIVSGRSFEHSRDPSDLRRWLEYGRAALRDVVHHHGWEIDFPPLTD